MNDLWKARTVLRACCYRSASMTTSRMTIRFEPSRRLLMSWTSPRWALAIKNLMQLGYAAKR